MSGVRCLRNGLIIAVVPVLSLSLAGCAYKQDTPAVTCTLPEGNMAVSLISGLDWWNYRWDGSEIIFQGNDNRFTNIQLYESETRLGGKWDEKKAGVGKAFLGPDYRVDVPFSVSPDGTFLAIAVYTEVPHKLSPMVTTDIALIRRSDRTLVHQWQFPHYIEALSWAPSGHYLAILFAEPVSGPFSKKLFDWFLFLTGHPSSYYTFRVGIYNAEGIPQCMQLFGEQVPEGRGILEWHPSAGNQ